MSLSKPGFLSLGTIVILGSTILYFVGSGLAQYKTFSSISGRHPSHTKSRHPPPLSCDKQNPLQSLTTAPGGQRPSTSPCLTTTFP